MSEKDEIKLLKEQLKLQEKELQIHKAVYTQSSEAMGLIENSKNGLVISQANNAFYKVLGLNEQGSKVFLREAFVAFENIEYQLIEQGFKKEVNSIFVQRLCHGNRYFKFSTKTLDSKQLLFTMVDITDVQMQKIEQVIKRKQLQETHKIANLGYWIEQTDAKKNFWSNEIYGILGVECESIEVGFDAFLNYVHPEDRAEVEQTFNDAKKSKSGYELSHRLLLSDGSEKHVNQRCFSYYNESGDLTHSIGIIQDVTNTIETETRLRVSEERFRLIFQNAPIAIILVNKDIKPVLSNMQFSHMTGYSYEDTLKMSLKDFTHPEDIEKNVKLYSQLFKGEIASFTLTKRYIRKDEKVIWVKVTVSAIHDNGINAETAIVMVQDITAEKMATAEVVRSEYKYRTLIENANDGIGLFDVNFKPVLYNTSLYQVLGFDLESYLKIDHSKYELFHPDDTSSVKKAFEDVKLGKKSRIEKRLRHQDGTYRYFSISYIPVVHDDKPAALIFRRDISKRKAAEAQNEEYRLFLETLMDNLPVSLFAKTTPDFRYLYWNKTFERLSGISAEDAVGQTDFELPQLRKDAKKYFEEDKKLMRNKQKLEGEYDFTNALGDLKRFRTIKTLHEPSVGNPMILGISIDVTQLREAETMVEQSSQMLREAQKIAKLGYWEYDVVKDLIYDNIENRQILGIQKLSYFLSLDQFTKLIHGTDRDGFGESFQKCITEQKNGESIVRINNGEQIKYISVNYKPTLDDEGVVIKVRGTTIDITRLKSSELALKESEYKLKQAEHIAKVGYWNYDYEKKETQFSDEVWNILELKQNNNPVNFADFFHNIHPDDKAAVNIIYLKSKNTNQPFDFDFRIVTSQNRIKHIKAKGTFVINKLRNPVRSIGIFQDITILKEKEIELEHSTSHLIEVQKLSKTGYIELQFDTEQTIFSETIWDILEIPKDSLVSQEEFNQLINESDKTYVEKTIQSTLETGTSHNIQYRLQLKSGKVKYVNEICIVGEHSNPVRKYATRVVQDITQIKQKDLTLEQSLLSLKEVTRSGVLGTWEYNVEDDCYFISEEIQAMLNLSNGNKPFRFEQMINLVHPEDRYSVKKVLIGCFRRKENYSLIYRVVDSDHNVIKHIHDSGRFAKNDKGQWQLYGLLKDITNEYQTKIELTESNDLLRTIVDNSLFATSLFSSGKHVYVNDKWTKLIGVKREDVLDNVLLFDLFESETAKQMVELFERWDEYKLLEYSNKMHLKPKNAPAFYAEVYIKEVFIQKTRSFLILAYDIKD